MIIVTGEVIELTKGDERTQGKPKARIRLEPDYHSGYDSVVVPAGELTLGDQVTIEIKKVHNG